MDLNVADEELQGAWDPLRLEQVVSNLLDNAAKFGSGKHIHISLSSSG